MSKVLVFLEQRNGIIKKASFEAARVAADIAGKTGSEVEAVCIGDEIESLEKAGNFSVPAVTHIKNKDFANYSSSAYASALAEHAQGASETVVVFANTSMAKEFAPLVAAKLDAGLAMDATAYQVDSTSFIVTRPVYAGKALIDVKITSPVKVLTLRPNVFNPGEPSGLKAAVTVKEVTKADLRSKVIETKKAEGKLDVAEADKIVSGGRGLKGPEHFTLIEELAEELGAAVGASRAVVDAGWRSHSEQVGQTGKTVSPNLYIAVAISGAIQHLAGMRSSKYIVAINKDKDAPIFQVADYGIVGDAFEIVPELIKEIKKIK